MRVLPPEIVFVNSAKMLKILSSKVSTWSGWCPQFVEFVFSDNFYCVKNKETWLKNIRYCAVKSVEILMTKIPPTQNSKKVSKIWSGNLVKITWQMCCAIS